MSASEASAVNSFGAPVDRPATVDPSQVAHFDAMAADWWDPHGSSALLHRLNPVRLRYIRDMLVRRFDLDPTARAPLVGLSVLDVGCGGGLLAEPLARLGAAVTGLDPAQANIEVARAHAARMRLEIDYVPGSLDTLMAARNYDVVTCLEVVEHVADRESFFTRLAALVRSGGVVILSTPNRTAASWAAMIAGAEWLLRLLPRGTHDWRRFITPEEMRSVLGRAGLELIDVAGIAFSPTRGFALGADLRIGYIGAAVPVPAATPMPMPAGG